MVASLVMAARDPGSNREAERSIVIDRKAVLR